MEDFTAFVLWPTAPLTERLVRTALESLTPQPPVITALNADLVASPGRLLQWATYDALDHDLTFSHSPASRVLSSSYVIRKALIRKHFLSRCIHNYLIKHPDSILTWGAPRTWELEISFADELDELWGDDLYDLSEEIEKGDPAKWWILKPGMADRGMGLRLFHTKEDLQAIFEEFELDESEDEGTEEDDNDGRRDTAVVTSQLRHFVIQVGPCIEAHRATLTSMTHRSRSTSATRYYSILRKFPWMALLHPLPKTCVVTKSARYPL